MYEECVKALGGTPLDKEEYWEMKRANLSWDKLLPLSGLSIDEKDRYLKLFIDRIESQEELGADELFKESLRTLEQLRTNGNKLYLLSLRRNAAALNWQIEHLGIRHLFEKILSGHSDTKEGDAAEKRRILSGKQWTIQVKSLSLVIPKQTLQRLSSLVRLVLPY